MNTKKNYVFFSHLCSFCVGFFILAKINQFLKIKKIFEKSFSFRALKSPRFFPRIFFINVADGSETNRLLTIKTRLNFRSEKFPFVGVNTEKK